jgi:hypothetical protein
VRSQSPPHYRGHPPEYVPHSTPVNLRIKSTIVAADGQVIVDVQPLFNLEGKSAALRALIGRAVDATLTMGSSADLGMTNPSAGGHAQPGPAPAERASAVEADLLRQQMLGDKRGTPLTNMSMALLYSERNAEQVEKELPLGLLHCFGKLGPNLIDQKKFLETLDAIPNSELFRIGTAVQIPQQQHYVYSSVCLTTAACMYAQLPCRPRPIHGLAPAGVFYWIGWYHGAAAAADTPPTKI